MGLNHIKNDPIGILQLGEIEKVNQGGEGLWLEALL